MNRYFGRIGLAVFLMGLLVMSVASADAMMSGGGGMGGGGMMTGTPLKNAGGMGMMGGMAGSPVVGSDGTAYLITFNPTAPAGTDPSDMSFRSRLVAITTAGTETSINLRGLMSTPVITGTTLIGTASLPDFTNYDMIGNYGTNPGRRQSALYFLSLPMTDSSTPQAVSLDGRYASAPVIANNLVYVVTTDFGRAMMQGNTAFQKMFGGYDFNSSGSAESYMYILNLDGTLVSKTLIQ
ncbi:MAG: hypothetical protein FIA94_14415 [Nitrospirae bacterium]|nr:hypothetical protein [Nitrospirota bacterium]